MSEKTHIVFDCETFSQDARKCAVIDFSIGIFKHSKMLSDKPYTMRDIVNITKLKMSVKDQVANYGYEIDPNTVDFWNSQGEAARKHIKPLSTDLGLEDFAMQFLDFSREAGKINYWWSRSNTFDPIIIERIMRDTNNFEVFRKMFPYWAVRDTRSFIDGALDFPAENGFIPVEDEEFWNKVFVKHDSSWDVLADALRIQAIVRASADLELIKR